MNGGQDKCGFSTITREFTYSVGSQTGLMMPILVILSSSNFDSFFREIFLAGVIIPGGTE